MKININILVRTYLPSYSQSISNSLYQNFYHVFIAKTTLLDQTNNVQYIATVSYRISMNSSSFFEKNQKLKWKQEHFKKRNKKNLEIERAFK